MGSSEALTALPPFTEMFYPFSNLKKKTMKKKVQAFTMWFFTLLLLAGFQGWAQAEFEITTMIDKTGSNLPLEQIGTGNNARAAALYQNRYVILPSREGGNNVWVWDTHNPNAAPFALNTGTDIIQYGLFLVNYVQTVGDKIYVSNMSLGSNADHPFRLYRWDGLTGTPEIILSADDGWGRLGDSFSIVGDLETSGSLVAHLNSGGSGQKKFKVWHFVNGEVQNLETPDEITLTAEVNMNSYGVYNEIPGETDKYLVTGNGMGIVVANFAGDSLTGWNTSIVSGRTMEPYVFFLNGKRYLSYVVNIETNTEDGAYYDIIDISDGASLMEAFDAVTAPEELNERLVHRFVLGAGDSGLSAAHHVYQADDGSIYLIAYVVDRGFVVEKLSMGSQVFFEENFNDGNAASRWSFVETGGTNEVNFAFDYQAAGIPLLEEESNGIGLKMAVNTVDPGLISAAMAFPNGQSFEGEYALSFDLWMNFELGTSGTTENAIFGTGHNSTDIQTPAGGTGSVDGTPGTGPSNNGVDYSMTPDNGASRDVRVFVDGAELLGAAGGFAGSLQSTQNPPYNEAYTGTEPGNQWLNITIKVLADRTIFKVNGQVWAETMTVADPGNLMLGYIDFFGGSVANANSYLVFDNVRVGEVEEEEPLARVQLIHNSADAALSLVDLYTNGELQLEDISFRTATPFFDATAGANIDLVITPANAPIEEGFSLTVNFTEGMTYVVVAAGNLSETGYDPVVPFDLFVYEFGQEAAVNPVNTDVLAFHGSTDAPTVTIWETGLGAGQIISDFNFGDFAGYLSLANNDYILEVRDETGTVTVAAYQAPLATLGLQGQALTVLASGFLNPANNSDGPAFGLYAALPAGGELIALPLYDDTVIIDEFPYAEGFEGIDFPPPGWNSINSDGTALQWLQTNSYNHTPGGEYAAFHNYNPTANEDGWFITPPVVIPDDGEYLLSFWSLNNYPSFYGKNSVLISTGSGNPADDEFVEVWTTPSVLNSWVKTSISLSDYVGLTIFFAFRYEGEDAHLWALDDILIDVMPDAYTVTFVVEDENENPITDAVVSLETLTNPAGNYFFDDVLPGTYSYTVVKEGYYEGTGSLEVVDADLIETVTLVMMSANPVITGITPVNDVEVPYGTSLEDAIAALPPTTTITDSDEGTHTVTLVWTIEAYDGNTPGDYNATAAFSLPVGVDQADPPIPLVVTAVLTVKEETGETFAVTFNVDMSYAGEFDPESDVVYLAGDLLGWTAPGDDPDNQTMSRVGETMVWTKTLELEAGAYTYKYFINAGWDGGEWDGGDDRSLSVEADMTVNDWFGYLNDPSSVNETEGSAWTIYPNPARTTLNIVSGELIRELRMIDLLGRVVYAADVTGESHRINVGSFENGFYFIQILTATGLSTQRVQIQH